MRGERSGAAATGGAQMLDDRFPVELVEGVPVLATPEEIDITNAEALRSALLTAAANSHRTLVVDMTQTQFCDSSALHTLLAAHKRAEAEGREVLLVIASTPVLRILALTSIDHMIPNFTSLPEALAQTGRDHQPSPAREPITSQAGEGNRCSSASTL
jgi:anti-sigma B factor antagonist